MTPDELRRVLRQEEDYNRNINQPNGDVLVRLIIVILVLGVIAYLSVR